MKKIILLLSAIFTLSSISAQEKFIEIGDATYYADYLDGQTTASGEVFSQDDFTTAHKTLPFGSIVKITNLINGKSVILRVNDRGPFHEGRIVDVSKSAAVKLDFLMEGHVNVKLELVTDTSDTDLESLNSKSASLTKNPEEVSYEKQGQLYYRIISKVQSPQGYGLQLGCYSEVENVIFFANKVRDLTRMPVFVVCEKNKGINMYKIFAGEISTEEKARTLLTHVAQLFNGAFIVKY